MPQIPHPYFADIDTDALEDDVDVCWEAELPVNGDEVTALLWAQQGATALPELDAFATFLQQVETADKSARAALLQCLEQDRSFIDFHVQEIEGANYPDQPEAFVRAMQLVNIGLWAVPSARDTPIVMDYMLDPEHSDQILAVCFHADGTLGDVCWES